MNKSLNLIIFTPIILNFFIIFIILSSSKNKSHPFLLLLILITLTLLISIKINFTYKSWLSFILFLIIIGGLIVIFMYITRLINNELFKSNYKIIILNILKILPLIIIIILILYYSNNLISNSNYQDSWSKTLTFLTDQININLIYKKFFNKSTIFIIFYLYYAIICIINICFKFQAPLRQILI